MWNFIFVIFEIKSFIIQKIRNTYFHAYVGTITQKVGINGIKISNRSNE